MKPKVLIATTFCWYPTARLAMALANAGFTVDAVCPRRHPLTKTTVASKIHTYNGLAPLRSLSAAIADAEPNLIIPGDDLVTQHLHRLYQRELRDSNTSSRICALIERSLGAAESFPFAYARADFMALAEQEGIRTPKTAVIANLDELKDWTFRNGLPAVLKANGTSGGDGVRIVRTVEDAERAFRRLQASPRVLRAVKHAVVDGDLTLIGPALRQRKFVVNAQSFVDGREATSAVACWKGQVLAALHFEVINKTSSVGHATVVRWIDNLEMSTAVEKVVGRLNLSGVHGFDFMLEEQTGSAYLIEINPRATQVGHLALGTGPDIPAALYAAVSGEAVQPAPKITAKDTIALFPQEWIRDPESPFLRAAYHDVPWEQPELVRDCVNHRRKQSAWYSRAQQKQVFSAISSSNQASVPAQIPAVNSTSSQSPAMGTELGSR
ncbi:MAG TPA: ATP-grasp domain-containing protein [Terriglobales bacterium]|nr:ATP-grasp domain-containing protein [Terriglobales bacterium]